LVVQAYYNAEYEQKIKKKCFVNVIIFCKSAKFIIGLHLQ